MSMITTFVAFFLQKNSREDRLVNDVKQHSGQYVVNENGTVSVDLSNPEAIKRVQEKLKKFEGFSTVQ